MTGAKASYVLTGPIEPAAAARRRPNPVEQNVAEGVRMFRDGGHDGVIAMGGIESNVVYYWEVPELLEKGKQAQGATIRLGGVVLPGSLDWNADTLKLRLALDGGFVGRLALAGN